MKKTILISILPVLAILFFVAAQSPAPVTGDFEWPEEITLMLDKACYDCHTSESSNAKAKMALNFTKWNDLKLSKQQKKLNAIKEEVVENSMPPGKYLKNYPDNALTAAEVTTLSNWIDETLKLMQP